MIGDDGLDQQQRGPGRRGRSDVAQDGQGLLIRPVVDDVLQHVRIGAGGHSVEERSGDDLHAVGGSVLAQQLWCPVYDLLQVVEHPAGRRRGIEDGGQQPAVATTDIGDRGERCEVVRRHDGRDRQLRHARHRVVEDLAQVRLGCDVLERPHAAQSGDDGLAAADRIAQVAPVFAVLRGSDEAGHPGHRYRCIGTQRVAQRIEGIPPVAGPAEDPLAHQGPHQPVGRVGVGVHAAGKFFGPQRAARERVGHTELGCDGNPLRHPGIEDHLQHHRGGWCAALMQPAQQMAQTFGGAGCSDRGHLGGSHRMTVGAE